MAKVVITFEDKPKGGVDMKCAFKPALKMKDGTPVPTPAQVVGAEFLEAMKGVAKTGKRGA